MSKKIYDASGRFDVSDIIKGLSQIQDKLAQMKLQPKGQSLFGNVEKDFKQLNSLVNSFQAQLEKGISNPQEMKAFNKSLSDIQQRMIQVKNGLQQVASVSLDENAKKAAKEFKEMQKEVEKMRKDAQQKLSDVIGKTFLPNKKDLQVAAQLGQLTKNRLKEEIEGKKQALQAAKEQLEIEKKIALENEKSNYIAQQAKKSLFKKGGPGLDAFSLTRGWSGTDPMLRAKGEKGGLSPSKFNGNASTVIDSEYVKALTEIAQKGGTATEVINKLTEALKKYGVVVNSDKVSGTIAADLNAIYTKANQQTFTAESKGVTRQNKTIQNLGSEITQLTALTTAVNQYEGAMAKADSREKNFNTNLEQTNRDLEVIRTDANNMTGAITSFGNSAQTASNQLQQTVITQNEFNQSIERLGYSVKYIFSITNAWRLMRQMITKTYNDVKNIDKAFAQIAMVTNYSVEDMWNQYGNYAKMATELGQSTESVIQASALYYQQGLDTAEALELTRDTMKLATLANLDFAEATSQMTAALRAFHMEMDEGSHVTDVYAEVAAHAAVDVNGLAQAMSATAAIANSSGMSFENTTAMLATMVEATQEAP